MMQENSMVAADDPFRQRTIMNDPLDPLAHLPGPTKRYRVLALTRGAEVHVEIWDEVEKRGVVLTFPEALEVAAAITLEVARLSEVIGTHLDREDGTIPEWERQISEWKKKGTGTEGRN
jgi:hypothetical protein